VADGRILSSLSIRGVNDLYATLLHLLGIEHIRLTQRLKGHDFCLTDVSEDSARGLAGLNRCDAFHAIRMRQAVSANLFGRAAATPG
jgi:hypothetical protein